MGAGNNTTTTSDTRQMRWFGAVAVVSSITKLACVPTGCPSPRPGACMYCLETDVIGPTCGAEHVVNKQHVKLVKEIELVGKGLTLKEDDVQKEKEVDEEEGECRGRLWGGDPGEDAGRMRGRDLGKDAERDDPPRSVILRWI